MHRQTTCVLSVSALLVLLASAASDSSNNLAEQRERLDESPSSNSPQPLLVINAGNGRTGTTSFGMAMERLGLKTYHMVTGVRETPGQAEMWLKFLVEQAITFDDVLDDISRLGFNASSDSPLNLYYKQQMARYPDAPVIFSIRPEDENPGLAWQRSMQESVLQYPAITANIPFRWLPSIRLFDAFVFATFRAMIGDADDIMAELFDTSKLAKFYEDFAQDVMQTVPSEKILVFKSSDGWKPLCDHIAHVSPIVAANCREVLEANEPYPHANDRQTIQNTQIFLRWVTRCTYMLLYLVGVLLVGLPVLVSKRRMTKGKKE